MTARTTPAHPRPLTLTSTTVGQKTVMAVSGLVAVGWVLLHMAGHLGVFAGRAAYNGYAAFIHGQPLLLWGQRLVFAAAVLVHIAAAIAVTRRNQAARGVAPRAPQRQVTNAAALSMRYGGLTLLAFIVYHVLHMTVGLTAHLGYTFVPGDAYNNLVRGLSHPVVAVAYIVAQIALGMHLYHGAWSLTQTLGWSHPRYDAVRERLALAVTVVVVLGFVSVPLSVLTGALQPWPAG